MFSMGKTVAIHPDGLLYVGFNFVFPDCSATAFLFHEVIGRTNSA
ncbi:hypothetical protein AZ007_001794 [Citrobacter freundii]|jgi:hypothetical protein|nr:hypothetical protein AZ007_001794 [Citrobacter freundii]